MQDLFEDGSIEVEIPDQPIKKSSPRRPAINPPPPPPSPGWDAGPPRDKPPVSPTRVRPPDVAGNPSPPRPPFFSQQLRQEREKEREEEDVYEMVEEIVDTEEEEENASNKHLDSLKRKKPAWRKNN